MIIKEITSEESMKENLETWCYEVGSRFERISVDAAEEFINWWRFVNKIKKHHNMTNKDFFITDLGSGDGAATNYFAEQGFRVTAVDINKEKLDKIINKNVFCVNKDIKSFLENTDDAENIFTHHSLEHTVEAKEIIELCGEKLKPGGLYYATVPAGDYLHSVHHIAFESAEELLPNGLQLLMMSTRERFGEKEFVCIATKP